MRGLRFVGAILFVCFGFLDVDGEWAPVWAATHDYEEIGEDYVTTLNTMNITTGERHAHIDLNFPGKRQVSQAIAMNGDEWLLLGSLVLENGPSLLLRVSGMRTGKLEQTVVSKELFGAYNTSYNTHVFLGMYQGTTKLLGLSWHSDNRQQSNSMAPRSPVWTLDVEAANPVPKILIEDLFAANKGVYPLYGFNPKNIAYDPQNDQICAVFHNTTDIGPTFFDVLLMKVNLKTQNYTFANLSKWNITGVDIWARLDYDSIYSRIIGWLITDMEPTPAAQFVELDTATGNTTVIREYPYAFYPWTRIFASAINSEGSGALFLKFQYHHWHARHRKYNYATLDLKTGTVLRSVYAYKSKEGGGTWAYEGPKIGDFVSFFV